MKFPLTMCFAYAGLSHKGKGRGQSRSAPASPADAMPIDWASEGEIGKAGTLGGDVPEGWFPWAAVVDTDGPSAVGVVGLLLGPPVLVDVPRSRALLLTEIS